MTSSTADAGHAPLTPAEMRQLLRECAVVVQPGETLVLRVAGLTPAQMSAYQDFLDAWLDHNDTPFRVLVVRADDLGVAAAGPPGP